MKTSTIAFVLSLLIGSALPYTAQAQSAITEQEAHAIASLKAKTSRLTTTPMPRISI